MGFAKFGPAEGEQRQKSTQSINVTVAMFFDGTDNNKNNTDAEKRKDKKLQDEYTNNPDHDNSSYENEHSNVANLWSNYTEDKANYKFKKYIEGIGTIDGDKDSTLGSTFGSGSTGILAKVEKGCKLIADELPGLFSSPSNNNIVATLTVDVFGFSRGSAAARNFVYEITKLGSPYKEEKKSANQNTLIVVDDVAPKKDLREVPKYGHLGKFCYHNGVELGFINIRFVGLFDCVASYSKNKIRGIFVPSRSTYTSKGFQDDTPKQFKNDTAELHLDIVGQKAKRVVHFTAADEHRGNFPLTNIESAESKGVGISFSFPGVHSDVGGGYPDLMHEYIHSDNSGQIILCGEYDDMIKEKERLKLEGWFNEKELLIKEQYFNEDAGLYRLYGERKNLRNSYSFIPLHLMCQSAIEFTKKYSPNNPILLNQKGIEDQLSIKGDTLLGKIKKRLTDYVFNNGQPLQLGIPEVVKIDEPSKKQYDTDATYVRSQSSAILYNFSQDDQELLALRHGYLHWNSNYNNVMILGVIEIHPMYPRMVDSIRQRLPLKG